MQMQSITVVNSVYRNPEKHFRESQVGHWVDLKEVVLKNEYILGFK